MPTTTKQRPRKLSSPREREGAEPAVAPGPVCVIDPNALYTLPGARAALGLSRTALRRECRLGRLRVSMRCGRGWILGSWLLAWIESGPSPRRAASSEGEREPAAAGATEA